MASATVAAAQYSVRGISCSNKGRQRAAAAAGAAIHAKFQEPNVYFTSFKFGTRKSTRGSDGGENWAKSPAVIALLSVCHHCAPGAEQPAHCRPVGRQCSRQRGSRPRSTDRPTARLSILYAETRKWAILAEDSHSTDLFPTRPLLACTFYS